MKNVTLENNLRVLVDTPYMAIVENHERDGELLAIIEVGDDMEPLGDNPYDHEYMAYQTLYATHGLVILQVAPLDSVVKALNVGEVELDDNE